MWDALKRAHGGGRGLPAGAILIEPAIPGASVGLPTGLVDSVRIINIVDPGRTILPVHRKIPYAVNIIANDCSYKSANHCVHGQRHALLVNLAHIPAGKLGDVTAMTWAWMAGVKAEFFVPSCQAHHPACPKR